MMKPRFLDLGDSALTLEFGDIIDQQLVSRVAALDTSLTQEREAGQLAGVVETVPTFRSLTVIFDPLQLPRAKLKHHLMEILGHQEVAPRDTARRWRLPVCYGGEYGPDLEVVAASLEMTPDEVKAHHAGRTYLVYMIGFLPGFPFMGDVEAALQMPRRKEPRVRVPAGSVAITGQLTAIYPWESPGGWQLLGRCPLALFDHLRAQSSLLAPGDLVEFQEVSPQRFQQLVGSARQESFELSQFLLTGDAP